MCTAAKLHPSMKIFEYEFVLLLLRKICPKNGEIVCFVFYIFANVKLTKTKPIGIRQSKYATCFIFSIVNEENKHQKRRRLPAWDE